VTFIRDVQEKRQRNNSTYGPTLIFDGGTLVLQ
jgi:hypothetical protein